MTTDSMHTSLNSAINHAGWPENKIEIQLDVLGLPRPQGSKRAWVNEHTGRAQMAEQTGENLKTWRSDVKDTALEYITHSPGWTPLDQALSVTIGFRFPRPKSHFRTGRNAHLLRDNAPEYPTKRSVGDIEKLIRSTHDALTTAGFWTDDSLVVHVDIWKVYCGVKAVQPGARIIVRSAPDMATRVAS